MTAIVINRTVITTAIFVGLGIAIATGYWFG